MGSFQTRVKASNVDQILYSILRNLDNINVNLVRLQKYHYLACLGTIRSRCKQFLNESSDVHFEMTQGAVTFTLAGAIFTTAPVFQTICEL